MDQLPVELQRKIFRSCSWQDRLVNLRLVNTRWNEIVDFHDLRRLRLISFRRLSNRRDDDGWVERFLVSGLPVVGASLESFGFEIRRCGSDAEGFGQRHSYKFRSGKYIVCASMVRAIATACPKLCEINFVGATVRRDAYAELLLLESTLTSLIMTNLRYADSAALAPVLAKLRLWKLSLSGDGVSELNTADNSLLHSIMLDDLGDRELGEQRAPADVVLIGVPAHQIIIQMRNEHQRRRIEAFVAKYPNLRFHRSVTAFEVFDFSTNAITEQARIYSHLQSLRYSEVFSHRAEQFSACIPGLARLFPRLERLVLIGRQLPCVETMVSFSRLKYLRLVVDTRLPRDQLAAVLSLENLKVLDIHLWDKISVVDVGENPNFEVRCAKLEVFRWKQRELPECVLSKVLDACPRLKVLSALVSCSDTSPPLINYATRLGDRCRLERLDQISFTPSSAWEFLALPLPRLVQLSINMDGDVYQKPPRALIGCRRLKFLQFCNSQMCEYLILATIINSSPKLERLIASTFNNCGHPHMLFYYIGRHPLLRDVVLHCRTQKPFERQVDSLLDALRDGRLVAYESGYNVRVMRVLFETTVVVDVSPEQRDELAQLRIDVVTEK